MNLNAFVRPGPRALRPALIALALATQATLSAAVPLGPSPAAMRAKLNSLVRQVEAAGMEIVDIQDGTIRIARRPADFCHTGTSPDFTRRDAFGLGIEALTLIQNGLVTGTPAPIVVVPLRTACWRREPLKPMPKRP